MKTLRRICMTLIVLGFLATSLACSRDSPESLSQELCDADIECGFVDSEERAECISELVPWFEEREASGSDCWDATIDLFDCSLSLSCEEVSDDEVFEAKCGRRIDISWNACHAS